MKRTFYIIALFIFVAGATGEATAMLLTQGKSPQDLTESEKQNVVALSQIASGLAGAVVGDSSQTAVAGAEIGKRAVENNALTPGDVYRAVKDLKEALANGKSVDEVYEKYRKLSQEQRAELLSNCGIDCRIPVGMLLNNANEMARSYSGLLGGWLSGLPISERGRFLDLIETENAITLQELDKRKGGFEKGLELGVEIAQSLRKDEARSNNPLVSNFAKKVKNPNITNKDWNYIPAPKKDEITGIKGLTEAKRKTSIRGGGKLRNRWKDNEGNIYEWDSQHGTLEKYTSKGKHLGEFNHKTGEQTKSADPTRRIEP